MPLPLAAQRNNPKLCRFYKIKIPEILVYTIDGSINGDDSVIARDSD